MLEVGAYGTDIEIGAVQRLRNFLEQILRSDNLCRRRVRVLFIPAGSCTHRETERKNITLLLDVYLGVVFILLFPFTGFPWIVVRKYIVPHEYPSVLSDQAFCNFTGKLKKSPKRLKPKTDNRVWLLRKEEVNLCINFRSTSSNIPYWQYWHQKNR